MDNLKQRLLNGCSFFEQVCSDPNKEVARKYLLEFTRLVRLYINGGGLPPEPKPREQPATFEEAKAIFSQP